MRADRLPQAAKSMGMGAILVGNVVLLAIALYLGNIEEFTTPVPALLSVYLEFALFLVLLFTLIGLMLNGFLFQRYLTILAITAILIWMQSNLLVWDYGLLDGRSIDWNQETWRGWLDLAVWMTALVLGIVFASRVHGLVVHLAVVLFVMQVCLSGFTLFQHGEAWGKQPEAHVASDALQEMNRFSSGENVVHIVADGFQADVFEEILSDPEDGAGFVGAMDGFVFFREHMGAFPLTHMSIPALLSGRIYRNHVPREAFLDQTIRDASILKESQAAGYQVDVAVPGFMGKLYERGSYTNTHLLPDNAHVTPEEYGKYDAFKLLDLALFRAAPHFLKRYVYNDQLWLMQSLLADEQYQGLSFFSHTAFLRRLRENMTVDREGPVYKYFHLMLSHNPMVTDDDCAYAGEVLPTVRANVKNQAKCGLAEIAMLLYRMKELGIYENATIVLMGDHGAWVRPLGYREGDAQAIIKRHSTVALAHPLMAIKRPGAIGPIQASRALTSITDTAATLSSVLNLDARFDGRSVFDVPEGDNRERRYHVYTFSRDEWQQEYLPPIHEFIIDGSVLDVVNWRRGEIFEAAGNGAR